MKLQKASEKAVPNSRGGSRQAIVEAAQRLFLERGFGAVSMDELAAAAGVARRTLYNQFSSKEEIFREMLVEVSDQFADMLPPGIETRGEVQDVLRLIARAIFDLHRRPGYLGFFRMVVADSRQFPWIGEAFAAVIEPQMERFARYLTHLTTVGVLDCQNPILGGEPVRGDAQPVRSVALDAGPRKPSGAGRGCDRGGGSDVPRALQTPLTNRRDRGANKNPRGIAPAGFCLSTSNTMANVL